MNKKDFDLLYDLVFKAVTDAIKKTSPRPDQEDQIMNTEELAEFLNYTPAYIRRLRREGKIPFYGEKAYRFSKKQVLAELKRQSKLL